MGKVIILFGVSGCGKSLVGKKLSKDLEFKFVEGDDLHSNAVSYTHLTLPTTD
mgnify:CR=1 FL=1